MIDFLHKMNTKHRQNTDYLLVETILYFFVSIEYKTYCSIFPIRHISILRSVTILRYAHTVKIL